MPYDFHMLIFLCSQSAYIHSASMTSAFGYQKMEIIRPKTFMILFVI